jgi:tRNA U55 pseudouridine synthase TruB
MIVDYYKNIGESMSDVINRFKIEYNLNKLEKVAFAGRLDPLAHGIVRLLTHTDKIYKDQECNHNKIYTYSVIESFQTDTYDIMGLINGTKDFHENCFENSQNIVQEYPKYSSKTINIDGKMVRLWDAAKNNLIKEDIKIPTKDVTIFFNKKESIATIQGELLLDLIISRINMVQGDFRQKEILALWTKNIDINKDYKIGHYKIKISSGGYVRLMANSMNSVAFDICRVSYE